MSSSDCTDSSNEDTHKAVAGWVYRNRAICAQQYLISTSSQLFRATTSSSAVRPCMTSQQTGARWVNELLEGHPGRFFSSFRLSKTIFGDLLVLLTQQYGLCGSRRTLALEVLALTLHILGHNTSMRLASERFQHSTETISRYFAKGIKAIKRLSVDVIVPVDPLFSYVPPQILNDTRYMPYFKDCIGAIDGTHVDARVPADQQVSYISRHGTTTQNVMAVCDFNMCFTFVFAGWEGSTHDSRIFQRAIMDTSYNFPYPPPGKYYVVDAGYPLQRGFLKPYAGTRYHLPDFARGSRPIQGRREIFNQAHSSLRSVIERSFGVWKKKWKILRDMPPYTLAKQRDIVIATMALHNFIRRHPSRSDAHFRACDEDEHFIYPEGLQRRTGQIDQMSSGDHVRGIRVGVDEMSALRDSIAEQLHRS